MVSTYLYMALPWRLGAWHDIHPIPGLHFSALGCKHQPKQRSCGRPPCGSLVQPATGRLKRTFDMAWHVYAAMSANKWEPSNNCRESLCKEEIFLPLPTSIQRRVRQWSFQTQGDMYIKNLYSIPRHPNTSWVGSQPVKTTSSTSSRDVWMTSV